MPLLTLPIGGFSRRLTALSILGSNTVSNNAAVSIPTGAREGDLLLCLEHHITFNPVSSAPAGFTTITTISRSFVHNHPPALTTYHQQVLSYKIATSTDVGGSTISSPNSTVGTISPNRNMSILVFRPNVRLKSVSLHNWTTHHAGGSTNISKTITSGSATLPSMPIGLWFSYTTAFSSANQRPFSPAPDAEFLTGPGPNTALRWKVFPAGITPQNITTGVTGWSGSKSFSGGYLTFTV